jgi:signal transduction histidine kinase/CheY-like chemotaxis protein
MNEIEAIKWQLDTYHAILTQQIDRLYNALEELQRTTLLLARLDRSSDDQIDKWLQAEGFAVDDDGFYQSLPLLSAFEKGCAPEDAVSFSWGHHLKQDPHVRQDMYRHRNMGPLLKHIHDRLGDIGWIYYQSTHNAALQYPYINQSQAITSDFDWSTYYTHISVSPENNPQRKIRWTPPSIDYAGEGLIICVSIPVYHKNLFMGLWSIDLPLRYLYRDFGLVKTYSDQMQFIANREGMLLLHEKLSAEIDQPQGRIFLHSISELGGQWSRLDLSTILAGKERVLKVTDANGEEWMFCFKHMPGVEWILFSGIPRSSMEEAAKQRLKQAFSQVAGGNYSHRIESLPTNSFATLIDAFNEMNQRLSRAEKQRNKVEKQLRQAQKLEAIGRLAGGVAHDYNNITNVIMGYSEMALEKIKKDDPLHKFLQEIYEAALRSMKLTRQLLTFARCQSVAPMVLDINQAVEGGMKMLNRMIGEDINLLWQPGKDIWPIEIDPSQIDQILANLCVNARDAISSVGEIIIETTNIEFDRHYCEANRNFLPGEFVQLTVTDNGKGMDKDTLEKIFEPFFSTKSMAKGTGLGLATVYGIIKQNNGFINVYSEPGKGASFKIYIPRVKGRAVETVSKSSKEIPLGRNETLLVVEDEPVLLSMVEQMLKALGYRVLAANSPGEAVTLAEHHPERITLLVTDVIMPQTTGRDLANQLQDAYPSLKVLFMSGYTSNVITHRGFLDRSAFLLQKPFSKKDLAIKVREVLSQSNQGKGQKKE